MGWMQVLKRRVKPYVPDFKLAFEHVCIHTGARPYMAFGQSSSAHAWKSYEPCTMAWATAPCN